MVQVFMCMSAERSTIKYSQWMLEHYLQRKNEYASIDPFFIFGILFFDRYHSDERSLKVSYLSLADKYLTILFIF